MGVAIRTEDQTIPQVFHEQFQPSRATLKAGPKAVEAWRKEKAAQEEVLRIQREEREANERAVVRAGIDETAALAKARKEKVERTEAGPLVVVNRDGVMWLLKKAKIHPVHADAALKLRALAEMAHGSGVKSCLNVGAGGAMSYDGPTYPMFKAKEMLERAFAEVGSPMIHPYLQLVAIEGEMLNSPRIVRAGEDVRCHFHACAIAFDLLARHFGMVR